MSFGNIGVVPVFNTDYAQVYKIYPTAAFKMSINEKEI